MAELENRRVVGTDGPPIWFEGTSQPNVTGSTGVAAAAAPQNIDIHPQLGTRKVAMVLVDTSESRYPADSFAIVQKWEDETINGVPVGASPTAAWRVLPEVSGLVDDGTGTMVPRFDITLDGVHGPVQLSGDWDDYFAPISATDGRGSSRRRSSRRPRPRRTT